MSRYKNILWFFLAVIFVAGCDNLPWGTGATKGGASLPPKGVVVVAKVGNFYISADELSKEVESYNNLLTQQGITQRKIDDRKKKIDFLKKDLVRKYILYQEALNRKLDTNSQIANLIENSKISILVTELLRQELDKVSVENKEIEDFYTKNKEILREPEQRKILEIVVPTEEEAKQVLIEQLKGGDFSALARQYSKSQSASKGGDLGYISIDPDPKKRIRFDKFYEVAFAPNLEKGGVSNIFKGNDGFYIIKIEDIKQEEAKTLSELWDNIKNYLLFEKQQNAISGLAKKLEGATKIEIYEGKID